MEVLRWDKRFSVGNPDIDLQHKMLFNIVNYLITGSGEAYKQHEMEAILQELVAYTVYHFTCEEEFMKTHSSFEKHCKVHAEFTDKVRFFQQAFSTGKEKINGELFSFLVNWIRDHILETDVFFFNELAQDTM